MNKRDKKILIYRPVCYELINSTAQRLLLNECHTSNLFFSTLDFTVGVGIRMLVYCTHIDLALSQPQVPVKILQPECGLKSRSLPHNKKRPALDAGGYGNCSQISGFFPKYSCCFIGPRYWKLKMCLLIP